MQSLVEFSQILNPGVHVHPLPPIMAVGFYADESEAAGKVFTLAGFMATPSGWDLLTPKWRQMLCDTGPYPVEAFHSADIEHAKPPFDGWPTEQRRQLVENALGLLADTTLCANMLAASCTFVLSDFHSLNPDILGDISRTYDLSYRVLFHNIITNSIANGIDFVFDERKKVQGRVQTHFRTAKASLDRMPGYAGKLNDIVFCDDRNVIPLQAADLLAYEIRRHTWTRLEKGERPMRSAYQRIKEMFLVKPQPPPPYRERIFRCYDSRFLDDLAVASKDCVDDAEKVMNLWYHLDAPED